MTAVTDRDREIDSIGGERKINKNMATGTKDMWVVNLVEP